MAVFSWLKKKQEIVPEDVTKQPARRPIIRDWTENYTASVDLLRGLYHNTYPGIKLAGGLAFPPIAVPVNFMGIPIAHPVDENDTQTEEELQEIMRMFASLFPLVHTFCHVDGTLWVWPKWSSKINNLIWEVITDDTVTDIIKDIETGEILEVITDEEITVKAGYNKDVIVRRKRTFTKKEIIIEWYGTAAQLPNELRSVRIRNVFNALPIPFANNKEPGFVRGHSDYERIISDLVDYHNTDLMRSTINTKFQPKMVQEVANVSNWLKNNGYVDISEIDPASADLFLNVTGEKTEFAWPERAYEAYSATLKQKFQKIVEASGTPEITWGLKTEGNRASVEESMDGLIKFVHRKQDQKNPSYLELFTYSLMIMRFVRMGTPAPEIKITWNDLDAVSDEVRSIILKNNADAMSKLIESAGLTKQQVYNFYKKLYPDVTEETLDEFIKGMSDMAEHIQWKNASYSEAMDMLGTKNGRTDDQNLDDEGGIQ